MAASVTGRVRVEPLKTERRDTWWLEPLITVVVLGLFVLYTTGSMLFGVSTGSRLAYFADPYISPFFSPCIATNCPPDGYRLSPGLSRRRCSSSIFPLAFRGTCYYYRKAYYRSFFWAPPACAVPDKAQAL